MRQEKEEARLAEDALAGAEGGEDTLGDALAAGAARVLLVVLVATCAEVLGSIGAYTYRLENLPAFVPPGHGLVYLAGLRISQSATVRGHRRAFLQL